jgi:hypothetical protein
MNPETKGLGRPNPEMAELLYSRNPASRILDGMDPTPTSRLRQPFVMFLSTVLLLVGAGMAAARTQGGPPWAQDAESCEATTTDTTTTGTDAVIADDCETEEVSDDVTDVGGGEVGIVNDEPVQADVQVYLAEFDNDCGAAFLGEYDLGDEGTLVAFDDLVTRLDSEQTSHGVQSVRVLLRNCEDHPNDGLMNALYHHGLNWVKHYEHEQWLHEKFANKWPEGKPGNAEHGHGDLEKTHGNPHTSSSSGSSHGNGYGHSK